MRHLRALPAPVDAAFDLPDVAAVDLLPADALPAAIAQLAALQARAAARLCQAATAARENQTRPSRLLTVAEVAARTGLSADYLYRHARHLPCARRFGRALRFDEAGLERWLASRRTR